MKINTITCHDVYNHGASLQAYALQTYLTQLGHDVEIIDYKPDYLDKHYKLWNVDNPVYDKPVVKQLYLLAKLPERLLMLKRKKVFDDFTCDYLKLTRRYHSNDELKVNPPQADVYIAGSDQIWNTILPNGKDPAFYLDFVPEGNKRIAYAASFATTDVADEYKPFVIKMLKKLDYISVRERVSLPLLSSLGRKDGVAVCDPVFLLSQEYWNSLLAERKDREKYLLIYDAESSNILKDTAVRIAAAKNLKIYSVSAYRHKYADKNYWVASPLQFVQLIRDADFVVSNSFHASAFSIIFQRDFCITNRSENINERMRSLLDDLGLADRLVLGFNDDILLHIDYTQVEQKLDRYIQYSHEFLKSVLS